MGEFICIVVIAFVAIKWFDYLSRPRLPRNPARAIKEYLSNPKFGGPLCTFDDETLKKFKEMEAYCDEPVKRESVVQGGLQIDKVLYVPGAGVLICAVIEIPGKPPEALYSTWDIQGSSWQADMPENFKGKKGTRV